MNKHDLFLLNKKEVSFSKLQYLPFIDKKKYFTCFIETLTNELNENIFLILSIEINEEVKRGKNNYLRQIVEVVLENTQIAVFPDLHRELNQTIFLCFCYIKEIKTKLN